MNHNLPDSIVDLLKERKLTAHEAPYLLSHLDMTPFESTVGGVSVIMIVYHTGKILFDSIEAVLNERRVEQFIIIDNGSPDDVALRLQELSEAYDHILLVQGHGNIGFAKAANLGAHLANQPWLVFLNPDAQLQPHCVERLVAATENQPSPCIVGARLLNPDLTEQRGARRGEVTPLTTLVSLLHLQRFWPALAKYEIHLEDQALPEEPAEVPTISGACFAMRRGDFARLKGFDTGFFLHVEDVDLCWRARQMGGVVLFHPQAEVIHEGQTSRAEPVFVEWNKGRGLVYYFRKRAKGFWRKLSVLTLSPFILGVSVLRAARRPRLKDRDLPAE
ncbi:MAG TPA: glycosyltransferase family 2 protein [Asticcacaulis sp.]|nr:glycosyltransferase family 2 protein [Asticcacaulis sp.]